MSRSTKEEMFFIGYAALAMLALSLGYRPFGWFVVFMAVTSLVGSLYYAWLDLPRGAVRNTDGMSDG